MDGEIVDVIDAPSDHRFIVARLYDAYALAVKSKKQMVFSTLVNQIKEEHLGPYFIYLVQILNIAHKDKL